MNEETAKIVDLAKAKLVDECRDGAIYTEILSSIDTTKALSPDECETDWSVQAIRSICAQSYSADRKIKMVSGVLVGQGYSDEIKRLVAESCPQGVNSTLTVEQVLSCIEL